MSNRKNVMKQRSAGPLDKSIGLRIRTARNDAGLSQEELGLRIGVTFQQVQKYEKGVNRISPTRLTMLTQVLGRPITYFVEEPDYKPNTKGEKLAQFVASRVGHQLCEAAMSMPTPVQQSLLEVAKSLSRPGA